MSNEEKKNKQQGDEEPQPQPPKQQVPHKLPEDHIEKMQRPKPWPEPPADDKKD